MKPHDLLIVDDATVEPKPLWKHSCPGCTWLGIFHRENLRPIDLYHCRMKSGFIFARYGDAPTQAFAARPKTIDKGAESFISGDAYPSLAEGLKRARRKGLVPPSAEPEPNGEYQTKPRFDHGCRNCIFLGRVEHPSRFDLYFCPQDERSVLKARFGHRLRDESSVSVAAARGNTDSVFGWALKRAEQMGLLEKAKPTTKLPRLATDKLPVPVMVSNTIDPDTIAFVSPKLRSEDFERMRYLGLDPNKPYERAFYLAEVGKAVVVTNLKSEPEPSPETTKPKLTTIKERHLTDLAAAKVDTPPATKDPITWDKLSQLSKDLLWNKVPDLASSPAYIEWRARRVVSNPEILNGEPVFVGSRLSVRHVGGVADKDPETLLEDYPYLTVEDAHFSQTFAKECDERDKEECAREAQDLIERINANFRRSVDQGRLDGKFKPIEYVSSKATK